MKLINSIKNNMSLKLRFYIKNFGKIMLKPTVKLKNKNIILIDAATYNNLGDQAITYSIEKFIKDKFNKLNYVEITEKDFIRNYKYIKKHIQKNDIICMNGGGNMGNLYPKYEEIRRIVIQNFKNNKIIIFPQTIDYTDDKNGNKEFKISKKIYNSNKNLLLCAREKKTYKKMIENYSDCKVELVPDIVLYLATKNNNMILKKHKYKIGICLREDKEGVLSIDFKEKLKKIDKSITFFDTMSEIEFIDSKNREKLLVQKLNEFSECDIVITDRLHGMIFSILAKTKCIAFDNSNKKISGVYDTVKDNLINVHIATEKNFDEVYYHTVKQDYIEDTLNTKMYQKIIDYINQKECSK